MITGRIMNEFMHGPVWVCEYGTGIEINDGSFEVEDYETPHILTL